MGGRAKQNNVNATCHCLLSCYAHARYLFCRFSRGSIARVRSRHLYASLVHSLNLAARVPTDRAVPSRCLNVNSRSPYLPGGYSWRESRRMRIDLCRAHLPACHKFIARLQRASYIAAFLGGHCEPLLTYASRLRSRCARASISLALVQRSA